MQSRLSLYRIGGLLTVEMRLRYRRLHSFKVLIPLPLFWRVRIARH